MRGEDLNMFHDIRSIRGSPPHARGRQQRSAFLEAVGGITPACAGKTKPRHTAKRCSLDHPRMRGEDGIWLRAASRTLGSPPHARGRLANAKTYFLQPGITPACAGKTVSNVNSAARRADHPRMRGEDTLYMTNVDFALGSPPHARGRRPRASRSQG